MNQLTFKPIFDSYTLVGILAALLIVALAFAPRKQGLSWPKQATLAGVRLAVVLLMLMAMLRPTLVYMEKQAQTATVAIVMDRSKSMRVRDMYDGTSRYEAMQKMMDDAESKLRELNETLNIKLYTFAGNIEPVELGDGPLELPLEPTGGETAIGAALEETVRREAGGRIAAVILPSDGTQRTIGESSTPPQEPARRLAELGNPLYTISFGQSRGKSQSRDLALESPLAPRFVFEKNPLVVTGEVRVQGYANQNLPVQLLFEQPDGEMKVVASTRVRASEEGQRVAFELEHIPTTPGEFKMTVRVEKQDGEQDTNNNEWSTFVTVRPGGLSVLYLEGQLRVEQRFIRTSLDASPDIQVDFLYINHSKKNHRNLNLSRYFAAKKETGVTDPVGGYDVFILGDIDSLVFREQDLKALAERVEQGAGLIMLGGHHSFAPGGYFDTPLAAVLPINMSKFDRQRFEDPLREKLHLKGPLKMQPTARLGADHPVMRLDEPSKNAAAWKALPPLTGANWIKLADVKRTATGVLAETAGANPQPLLIAGTYGDGRVLALAGDSTWQWWLQGHETAHRKFWRQIVLWLAKYEPDDQGSVWIDLAQRRYRANQIIDFKVGATSAEGDPVTDANFDVKITEPDGTPRRVRLAKRSDHYRGIFPTGKAQTAGLAAGDYLVEASATKQGKSLGTARVRFTVDSTDLELDNPVADPTLMRALADMTAEAGGRAIEPNELADLLDELAELPAELEVEKEVKITYYDRPWLLVLFVGLLGVEWFLRKRWGMV
ncbi:MAG: glutamine amidotransferase [Pirellulales bacterium]|nr:glutamine amidotransferase [Pirellulales bacterium]